MAAGFAEKVRPVLVGLLEPGETLHGVLAATHQTTFGGGLYALGVTDRRLLLQALDRRLQPKGAASVVTPETLVSADVDGAGHGWWTAPMVIMDKAAVALRLRTTDGERTKLLMMKGGGTPAGGPEQADGLRALVEWM
jgi:hypothetical protein